MLFEFSFEIIDLVMFVVFEFFFDIIFYVLERDKVFCFGYLVLVFYKV